MNEEADLRKLYLAFESVGSDPQIGPLLGELISTLGSQLHAPGEHRIGEFAIGDITYRVDLSDRFGRACVYGGCQERNELDLFLDLCNVGSVVWDIGANFGLYGIAAASKAGPSGAVFAVEPSTRAMALLKDNADRNASGALLELYSYAVADFDGTAPFHEAEETVFSGLSDTHRSKITATSSVTVHRFDSLWHEAGRRPIDLMKVDVEGHEGDVFSGAVEAIAASPNIVVQFEVSSKNLDETRRQKLIAALRRFQKDGMALWHLDSQRRFARLPMIEDDLSGGANGNLFMTRQGMDRERQFISLADRIAKRSLAPTTELEQSMLVALRRVIAQQKGLLAREISKANRLNQELEAAKLKNIAHTRPALGRRLRHFALAKLESVTAIIRVTAEDQDLAAASDSALRFCKGWPVKLIIADGRTASSPMNAIGEAGLVSPAFNTLHRYERATLAALRSADTSHILILDADGVLQGSLKEAVEYWLHETSPENRLAGLAFACLVDDVDAVPMQEDTLGGMLAMRYGLLATEAFRTLDSQPETFTGDGFDLDLSLRLWHGGFELAEAPDSICFRAQRRVQQRPVYREDDQELLKEKWTSVFTHPNLPAVFKAGGLRTAKKN